MADEEKKEMEEMNDENDAREEDVIEDTNADTKDVEKSVADTDTDISRVLEKVDSLYDVIDKLTTEVSAIRDAQSVMAKDATIIDTDMDNDGDEDIIVDDVDEMKPLSELDFSID